MSEFIVDLTNGARKKFETVERLEAGWIRCTRPRTKTKPHHAGDETTKYYPLVDVESIRSVR
ncbi:hypothetical protein [Natronococcus wangiae]|uniref:hypothetical protein n=1 Tax=Natronococcus wangiae TaxID=3068275 RepID=UPI00273D36D9|nr:hypothetical protein [Natronococcus sp. AD5]